MFLLLGLISFLGLLLDDPLVFPVGPLDNPLDDLVALAFLALDRRGLVVDDVVELDVVVAHNLQLRMHGVGLHVRWPLCLGQTQARVEKRVRCEGKGQVGPSRLLGWQGKQGRGGFREFLKFG